ncbi:AzlD domain-containing protein [Chitinimonas koreensis]|uniref:AzlD domain-containing protein n=1 Tax=Chitinimonas koreensis TaxID=356302 RepID=UPI0004081F07|nr:AzlD domain-containing protein [Chitinimonas koreensis]QNM95648.1 AzlD domain-containing protein [Chitinimonas koreensis]
MNAFELAVIAGMTAVTFTIRYAFFALGDKVRFPPLVKRALRYVPVAVLTAITVPMVLLPDGQHWQLDWRNAWLAGALASGLIAWRWNKLLAAIGGGIAVFFAWGWLVG